MRRWLVVCSCGTFQFWSPHYMINQLVSPVYWLMMSMVRVERVSAPKHRNKDCMAHVSCAFIFYFLYFAWKFINSFLRVEMAPKCLRNSKLGVLIALTSNGKWLKFCLFSFDDVWLHNSPCIFTVLIGLVFFVFVFFFFCHVV